MRPMAAPARDSVARTSLPANQLAPAGARRFVRNVLAEAAPAGRSERFVDDAVLLTSELVTNAVMYAGTDIEVVCYLETGQGAPPPEPGEARPVCAVVEVADSHPSSVVRAPVDVHRRTTGFGLQLVSAMAESWGVTYRRTEKAVWFRIRAGDDASGRVPPAGEPRRDPRGTPVPAPPQRHDRAGAWEERGGPSFLAETSELLSGQLDEDMVAALVGQLLVPRLADWCAVWLSSEGGGVRLTHVWHADERRIDALRHELAQDPPSARFRTVVSPWPWPESADPSGGGDGAGGSALSFPLITGGVCLGVLLLGRAGQMQMTDAVARTVDHVARSAAQTVVTARQYTQQATISRALQRGQLPSALASIPGVETAIVYEPHGEGQTVGGDFYDLFPVGGGRWGFLLGDVQGKDPEAMSVTGLARHRVRLLARDGHGVASVLGRLNAVMAEESAEVVSLGGEQARPRFLSLLYGELEVGPASSGAHCTVASAGHPLPLLLSVDGSVEPAAEPQILLGIDEGADFSAASFRLEPGATLLCVTDGVTERRCGNWQFDDEDGLSDVLRECAGLGARAVAEHVRRSVHAFATTPVEDDLSVLVLHALAVPE